MMTKDTALRMAIEAMTSPNNLSFLMAITACKEALEQSAQEPVLVNATTHDGQTYKIEVSVKEWQGLSDDEKLAIIRKWKDAHTMRAQELIGLGDAFEQALKEKNT